MSEVQTAVRQRSALEQRLDDGGVQIPTRVGAEPWRLVPRRSKFVAFLSRIVAPIFRFGSGPSPLPAPPFALLMKTDPLAAPCRWCGYNGAGYYQEGTHNVTCPWFNVGGESARREALARNRVPDSPS